MTDPHLRHRFATACVCPYVDLVRQILEAPPHLGSVRWVSVDGPSGAGKTTIAQRLSDALGAAGATVEQVHVDDLLDGWDDLVTFWPRLERQVLTPLANGLSGRYRRYNWRSARFDEQWWPVDVPDVLIVEGVSSARAAAADRLALAVMVVAESGVRLLRTLRRDGAHLRPRLIRWMRDEDRHFAGDDTLRRVDVIIDGDPNVAHDHSREFIRLRSRDAVSGDAHVGSPVMALTQQQHDRLRSAVAAAMPGVRADLERLVRIPSVAFPGFDHGEVDRSAEAVAQLLRDAGVPDVRIVRAGGQPAVIGRRPGPPGAPTVLLYAHHDVQPVGDRGAWLSEPFVATERDGRLYGRGAADDKAGVMAHIAALRALGDDLPVGVTFFIEGEEEFGSESLQNLIEAHHDDLAADVIVIADSANWDVGVPALTTSLRGLLNCFVEVRTLDHAVHSGMFGGAVPDALTALCRLIASLHDESGDVAVAGLVSNSAAALDYPIERFRRESGLADGVEPIGTGSIVERLWTRPAIAVLGIDAPPTGQAPNALVPTAKAKISVRIAPGDSPDKVFAALDSHLHNNAPWGAQVTVTTEQSGDPCVLDATGPAYDAVRAAFTAAWGSVEPVEIGIGGSIPFIATFQTLFPDAAIIVTGVEDPDSRAHGPNESLHLAEFERVCLGETLFLANLGRLSAGA